MSNNASSLKKNRFTTTLALSGLVALTVAGLSSCQDKKQEKVI